MHLKCKNNGNNQFLKLNFEYLSMLNHFYKLLFMMTFLVHLILVFIAHTESWSWCIHVCV